MQDARGLVWIPMAVLMAVVLMAVVLMAQNGAIQRATQLSYEGVGLCGSNSEFRLWLLFNSRRQLNIKYSGGEDKMSVLSRVVGIG